MWEVIIPVLLVRKCVSFWIDCEQKEEGEEGAEELKLVSTDITQLGQYMVLVVKGHEKCINWVSVDRVKKCCHDYTEIVWSNSFWFCFYFYWYDT